MCNRCAVKSEFYAFYAFCEPWKSITYLFSKPCQGPNPTLSATRQPG
jgi:hypothetical protein